MTLFFTGIVLLVVGYYTYGKFVDWVLSPDDRDTPAITKADGVDFVVLPHWKNMLIQLLNIAGIGPVIGVILGIKFGPIVFLLIPIGNVFGGAVHDYVSGMYSLRHGGSNLPTMIRTNLGTAFYGLFLVFMSLLLLLVVAVFVNVPAQLCDSVFFPQTPLFWWFVGTIFVYYILATLFPIDQIIGRFYPIFGAMLLIGTGLLFVALVWGMCGNPALLTPNETTAEYIRNFREANPIIPCLFVTIACGILSGFHATQSPIIARTMKSERQARSTFYGMMIVEGLIGMVWAAGAMAIYNLDSATLQLVPTKALGEITTHFLGSNVGAVTVIAVVILAITSGDTALRSLRLSMAESLHIPQRAFFQRLGVSLPLILMVAALIWWSNQDAKSFGFLWNYFAWANQVLAACTLMSCTVWMLNTSMRRFFWIPFLPGLFMTFVVTSFILWTSPAHKGPYGFGLELQTAYIIAGVLTVLFSALALFVGCRKNRQNAEKAETLPEENDAK